jgi:cell division protein FtsL
VTITETDRNGALRARTAPKRSDQPQRGKGLRVVSKRELKAAIEFRRARAMILLAAALFVTALFIIGMGQNMLAMQQIRIDTLQQRLTTATQKNENLLLTRAQLESPSRILQLAQHQLDMVTPPSVVYLTPVATGPTVADSGKESIGAAR